MTLCERIMGDKCDGNSKYLIAMVITWIVTMILFGTGVISGL